MGFAKSAENACEIGSELLFKQNRPMVICRSKFWLPTRMQQFLTIRQVLRPDAETDMTLEVRSVLVRCTCFQNALPPVRWHHAIHG
jgi:hypothetical protein